MGGSIPYRDHLANGDRLSWSIKGIRLKAAVKCALKCWLAGAHLLAHLTATPTRIPLTDLLPSVTERQQFSSPAIPSHPQILRKTPKIEDLAPRTLRVRDRPMPNAHSVNTFGNHLLIYSNLKPAADWKWTWSGRTVGPPPSNSTPRSTEPTPSNRPPDRISKRSVAAERMCRSAQTSGNGPC
jgi:hypothetical protein